MDKKNKRFVINEVKKNSKYMILSFVIIVLSQILTLIPPQILKVILDSYIPNKQISKIYLSIMFFCCIPLIVTLMTSLFQYYAATRIRKLGFNIRKKVFLNILNQPLEFFKTSKAGELTNYCRDTSDFLSFLIYDIPKFLSNVITFIIILFILFTINYKIALLQLLAIPVIILPSRLLNNVISNYAKNIMDLNGKISHITNESFIGIKTVKTFMLENERAQKLENTNNLILNFFGKTIFWERFGVELSNQCLSFLFVGVSFSYASLQIINGTLSIGQIVEIITYLPLLFTSLRQCTSINLNFNKKLAEYKKPFEFLSIENECNDTNKVKLNEFKNSICFDNVSFSYDNNNLILDQMNLEIKKNELIALIGPSGIGKSTIFSLLNGFYKPTSGNIYIDGININNIKLSSLRNKISLCSQDYFLFGSTIKENLLLANPNANDDDIQSAISNSNLDNLILKLPNGIDSNIGENGSKLSGGEKQRVALAMALIKDSDIILLDEITSSLDNEAEELIKQAIEKIFKESDKTIILISHNNDLIKSAKKIYKINDRKALLVS